MRRVLIGLTAIVVAAVLLCALTVGGTLGYREFRDAQRRATLMRQLDEFDAWYNDPQKGRAWRKDLFPASYQRELDVFLVDRPLLDEYMEYARVTLAEERKATYGSGARYVPVTSDDMRDPALMRRFLRSHQR